MTQTAMKHREVIEQEEVLSSKKTLMNVLSRAADDTGFMAQLSDDPKEALAGYYVLSSEQLAALASGDLRRIENWIGKLDDRLEQWLVNRMSQEKW
ncbi:MAG: hypothetical protein JW712_10715 [Dehalococcoidales bacterium]|nr:hypothetical protein [Dehalococcoidales bacterium]